VQIVVVPMLRNTAGQVISQKDTNIVELEVAKVSNLSWNDNNVCRYE
jgi:hypothetical protein